MTGWQSLASACFGRSAALARVRAPTLVLHGELDVMSPVANARLLADGIPAAELHVAAGAGHAVPLEQPEATARLLLEWIERHADVEPPAARPLDVVAEQLARPFALQAGALRNSRDGAAAIARGLVRSAVRRARARP
jgi:hypothetical protein